MQVRCQPDMRLQVWRKRYSHKIEILRPEILENQKSKTDECHNSRLFQIMDIAKSQILVKILRVR